MAGRKGVQYSAVRHGTANEKMRTVTRVMYEGGNEWTQMLATVCVCRVNDVKYGKLRSTKVKKNEETGK